MNRRDFLKGVLASAVVCCASGLVPETREMSLEELDSYWSEPDGVPFEARYGGYYQVWTTPANLNVVGITVS